MHFAADGRPRVLAFVRAWHPESTAPRELSSIRAQLRGLGATMIIASDAGAWSFAPDDDLERFTPNDGSTIKTPRALATLAAQHGVESDEDAVFVLDGDGKVRFSHLAGGALQSSLARALAAAGEALLAKPPVTRMMFDRREWAIASLCAGFALALLGCKTRKEAPPPVEEVAPKAPPPTEYDIVLNVNGVDKKLRVDPRVSLLDALRERLGLPGTKKGCDAGQCGACTVHLDGARVNSCLQLAIAAQGKKITTIEGLANGNDLHPVQSAFVQHDGFQCGYCTPGQIMSAVALLAEGHAKTDDDIREQMSGNICRCGAYPNILAAVRAAAKAV